MDDLWSRRNNSGKLSLVTGQDGSSRNSHNSFQKRFGGESSSNVKPNPFNTITTTGVLSSPTSGASSAFGLGSGAFASFGSAKTPKTPGGHFFDNPLGGSTTKTLTSEKPAASTTATTTAGVAKVMGKRPSSASLQSDFKDSKARVSTPSACGPTGHPLRNGWVFWFRPPISKANGYIEYEKTVHRIASCETVEEFYSVYKHLKRPSSLPLVSDYHLFKKGVRPIWEDEENKKGGKWVVRLKKGVADRYWEDILLAIIGDQFSEASDEVCGVVLSVRNGEDILSIWARADGGRVLRIRETMKRILAFPSETKLEWKSHDTSLQHRTAIENAHREKANNHHHAGEKRVNKLITQTEDSKGTAGI